MEVEKEFPGIPSNFKDFRASPRPYEISAKELTLKNYSKQAVLFKVKCTNNKHIKIEECADILMPGNETAISIKQLVDNIDGDSLFVVYTLVGKQWQNEDMSAYRCWERAKKQAVSTKCILVRIKTERAGKERKNEKEKMKSDD